MLLRSKITSSFSTHFERPSDKILAVKISTLGRAKCEEKLEVIFNRSSTLKGTSTKTKEHNVFN